VLLSGGFLKQYGVLSPEGFIDFTGALVTFGFLPHSGALSFPGFLVIIGPLFSIGFLCSHWRTIPFWFSKSQRRATIRRFS
jgi:hypothetical protein